MGILTDNEGVETDSNDKPLKDISIMNCGEILPGEDLGVCENDGTEDKFPHHPEDLDEDWYLAENFDKILEICKRIKESGNWYYREKKFVEATRKYRKCCKYITMLRDSLGQTDDDEEPR